MATRNAGLDAARALAIALVVAAHLGTQFSAGRPYVTAALVQAGGLGVDLFFSLSGFLIGRILIREAAGLSAGSVGRFLVRRWLRTLPAYYAVLGFLAWYFGSNEWASFLFLQNFGLGPQPSILIVSWSLVLEELFYLTFPLLMLGLRPFIRAPDGLAAAVAGLLILWSVGARLLVAFLGDPADPTFHINPVLRLDCAAYGVLAACAVARWPWVRPAMAARRVAVTAGVGAFCAAMVGVTFLGLRSTAVGLLHEGGGWLLFLPLRDGLQDAVLAVLVVAWFAWPASGAWRGIAGQASGLAYAIYLVHAPIMFFVVPHWATREQPALFVGLTLAATLACAVVLNRAVERPFLALRDKLAPSRGGAGVRGVVGVMGHGG